METAKAHNLAVEPQEKKDIVWYLPTILQDIVIVCTVKCETESL
jgi:hypothetical protein